MVYMIIGHTVYTAHSVCVISTQEYIITCTHVWQIPAAILDERVLASVMTVGMSAAGPGFSAVAPGVTVAVPGAADMQGDVPVTPVVASATDIAVTSVVAIVRVAEWAAQYHELPNVIGTGTYGIVTSVVHRATGHVRTPMQ